MRSGSGGVLRLRRHRCSRQRLVTTTISSSDDGCPSTQTCDHRSPEHLHGGCGDRGTRTAMQSSGGVAIGRWNEQLVRDKLRCRLLPFLPLPLWLTAEANDNVDNIFVRTRSHARTHTHSHTDRYLPKHLICESFDVALTY